MEKRTIAILGATGSIGTQALDIVSRYPDRFDAVCLTAHASSEKLFDLVRRFRPRCAALNAEPADLPEDVRFCEWFFGPDATVRALKASKAQDALCAIVGIAGLDAVWAALDVCQRVLLANKEALVTGGDLVMRKAAGKGIPLLPVDSEHSAIFQCLQARQGNPVKRLLLTASGGALRTWEKAAMYDATVRDVLKHPTWCMGGKITVDCASMVNKGLEIIEAHHLFDMPAEQIDVVIHPQSVIHSMVEYTDGSVKAQLAVPDMRLPIEYALTYPDRGPAVAAPLDFMHLPPLTFESPDTENFPGLALAYEAGRTGGTLPTVYNAANEWAVAQFLAGRIGYLDIVRSIEKAMLAHDLVKEPDLDAVLAAEAWTRKWLQKG